MQKTRSWQDSFDRLEAARREDGRLPDAEAREIREAEAAYARAIAEEADKPPSPGFMLASEKTAYGEVLAKPKPRSKAKLPAKPAAKPDPEPEPKTAKPKTAPRKRAAARRTPTKSKVPVTKAPAAKPKAARPRKAAPPARPVVPSPPPLMELPPAPAEELLIKPPAPSPVTQPTAPLPRSASMTPYRKTGLFGLIGSWLRVATRQAKSGLAASVQRPKVKVTLRKPAMKFRTPFDEIAELKAENARLRSQLEALLALREMEPAAAQAAAKEPALP